MCGVMGLSWLSMESICGYIGNLWIRCEARNFLGSVKIPVPWDVTPCWSVAIYQSKWRKIPEDLDLHRLCCENLKSRIDRQFLQDSPRSGGRILHAGKRSSHWSPCSVTSPTVGMSLYIRCMGVRRLHPFVSSSLFSKARTALCIPHTKGELLHISNWMHPVSSSVFRSWIVAMTRSVSEWSWAVDSRSRSFEAKESSLVVWAAHSCRLSSRVRNSCRQGSN